MHCGKETIETHPTPYEDGIKDMEREVQVCGFANEQQMTDWFREDGLRWLRFKGFKVYGYTVPVKSVVHGNTQVVFDPSLAKQRVCVV